MAQPTDEEIRKMAKARAGFKSHLAVYVLVNLLLTGGWLATRGSGLLWDVGATGSYWPVWTHLGWGVGLAFHWFFVMGPGRDLEAREERRLRERMGRT